MGEWTVSGDEMHEELIRVKIKLRQRARDRREDLDELEEAFEKLLEYMKSDYTMEEDFEWTIHTGDAATKNFVKWAAYAIKYDTAEYLGGTYSLHIVQLGEREYVVAFVDSKIGEVIELWESEPLG